MKLLSERIELVSAITESADGKKEFYIEGIFLQGGIKNKNGRVYPVEMLDEKVSAYIGSTVKLNRAYGELGHSDNASINLDRVSHIITSLVKEGKNWVGKARVLDTPMGTIAKQIVDGGGQLGVSSRGIGSLKEQNGVAVVQPDYMLCTAADIVADPSAPDAYVQGIMENREWMFVDGVFTYKDIEDSKLRMQKTSTKQLHEQALKEFALFLRKLY
jgi:hypothetical protein